MICKHCGAAVPYVDRHKIRMVTVDGIGSFHASCIKPEQVAALEQRVDDVKRWAIDVGIIHVHADHDREHAHAPTP